jgi:hypothetical protein
MGLKIRCPQGRAGSTPALGTITNLTGSIICGRFPFGCVRERQGSWAKDDAKMTYLLTRASREFDNLPSWFGEFVYSTLDHGSRPMSIASRNAN